VCYCYTLKRWQDCLGYEWGRAQPNTPILRFRRRGLRLGDVWTIPLPAEKKALADETLAQQVGIPRSAA